MMPIKLILGGSAILALLFTFAMQRTPAPPAAAGFDATWPDIAPAVLKKADRFISTEPKSVVAERVMPDVPVSLPPAATPFGSNKPKAKRGRHPIKPTQDICSRHKLRKVITGRSWHCAK